MEHFRPNTEPREALEQQAATAEVLGVINSSPGDLAPVFDAILEKAHTLCGAEHGTLAVYDGEHFRVVALRAMPKLLADMLRQPFRPSAGGVQEGLLRGEPLVHIPDVTSRGDSATLTPIQRAAIASGIRTLLLIPLRKDGRLLGFITAHRREVNPFSDKQIALLQNFAAQAVIAMENARLITETRNPLEQQTATAEVLEVINSSPGDLNPVFVAMLDKALRLCSANFGLMNTYDGEHFHHAADHGVPASYAKFRRERGPTIYGSGTTPARLIAGENFVHTPDLKATEPYERGDPARRALVDLGGARSHLTAALRKGDLLLGDVSIYRQDPHPFTDKQVALLQNFAAQAVIAMENARLITETREALEQQTATAEVLGVINSSPGDLAQVFDAMLEKAMQLCAAAFGTLATYEGNRFHLAASSGLPESQAEYLRTPWEPGPGGALYRLVGGDQVVHLTDIAADAGFRSGSRSTSATQRIAMVEQSGAKTALWVALRKDEGLIGTFVVYRTEVRPFSGKQIALLQNFAA